MSRCDRRSGTPRWFLLHIQSPCGFTHKAKVQPHKVKVKVLLIARLRREAGGTDLDGSWMHLPLIRQPVDQFAFADLRQVRQQLREVQLRVHVVAAAGAGQGGQDRGRSAATRIADEEAVFCD